MDQTHIERTMHPRENAQEYEFGPSKYVRAKVIGLLVIFFILAAGKFFGLGLHPSFSVKGIGTNSIVDFDVFYLVSQMVWRGDIDQPYHFASMGPLQEALAGEQVFLPWTYPPQFNLIVAPLALFPLGIAYVVFTGGTLVAYLLTLKVLAGR